MFTFFRCQKALNQFHIFSGNWKQEKWRPKNSNFFVQSDFLRFVKDPAISSGKVNIVWKIWVISFKWDTLLAQWSSTRVSRAKNVTEIRMVFFAIFRISISRKYSWKFLWQQKNQNKSPKLLTPLIKSQKFTIARDFFKLDKVWSDQG